MQNFHYHNISIHNIQRKYIALTLPQLYKVLQTQLKLEYTAVHQIITHF
jgi:hypothetical protein